MVRVQQIWRNVLLTFFLSALVLAVVLFQVSDPISFLKELHNFPISLLLIILGNVIIAWMIDFNRIRVLTIPLGGKIPRISMFFTLLAGNFLTLATPFAIGGAPIIVYALYKFGMSFGQASAVVIGAGLAAHFALLAILSVTIIVIASFLAHLPQMVNGLYLFIILYTIALIGFIILMYHSEWLEAWIEGWIAKRKNPKRNWFIRALIWLTDMLGELQRSFKLFFQMGRWYFLASCLIGIVYFLLFFSSGFILLTEFGVLPEAPIFRYGLSVLLSAIPFFSPLPGGTGTAELGAYLALDNYLPSNELGTFIILWRTFTFYLPLIVGSIVFPFLFLYLKERKS